MRYLAPKPALSEVEGSKGLFGGLFTHRQYGDGIEY